MSTLELIEYALPKLLLALIKYTLPLAIISFIFGMIIAFMSAIIRVNPKNNLLMKIIKRLIGFYIVVFRGTPLLVQLFLIFYGLPKLGIMFDSFTAAVITFALNVGAYNSEVIRASIESVHKGQWEAGESLNLTYHQIMRFIILPQSIRISIPSLSNSFISLIKDTSLASSITIVEMFTVGQQITAETFDPLLIYTLVALIYLVVCTFFAFLQTKLEKHYNGYLSK